MLGISRRRLKPDVAAFGKHPAFSDYIRVNTALSMVNALVSWVDEGMKSGAADLKKNGGIHSFRFWTRGIHKQSLILGIVKDSSDSMGRIYPLLITGQVFMKDMRRQWHRVFDSFGQVFRAFEEMTAARYDRFKEFETALSDVRCPEIETNAFDEVTAFSDCLAAWSMKHPSNDHLILPMPVFLAHYQPPGEPGPVQVRNRIEPPKAVFIGGLPEKPIAAIYQRPLRTNDFCTLFDLSPELIITPHRDNC
jgi:type VI secretion system protein VasJ